MPHGKTGPLYQYQWGGWTFDFDNTAYLLYHSGQFWNPLHQGRQTRPDAGGAARDLQCSTNVRRFLNQIADYTADQAYEIPLYNSNTLYAINKRVHNLPPTPDIRFRFLDTTVE